MSIDFARHIFHLFVFLPKMKLKTEFSVKCCFIFLGVF
ncbi:hypothetical protein SC1_00477 [Sphingopyxis sp. C-1]|nr:hypothetical protein SC1_00477 [Sphingopyxis sp. C-1]